jgi:hypothetical protein
MNSTSPQAPLRLVMVYHELPYPVNHGGRLDVWRRIQALASQGVQIHLVCWRNAAMGESLPPADSPLLAAVQGITVLEEKGKFAHPHLLLNLPGYARRRLLSGADWQRLQSDVGAFAPDVVLLEGLFALSAAQRLAQHVGRKLIYRSHNIESRYAHFIFERAQGARARFNAWLNVPGIEQLENRALASSHWFFDCSPDDCRHWHEAGHTHGEWLPLMVEQKWATEVSDTSQWAPTYDVGYLGNLYQPNNVEGILWFLNQAVPQLRQRLPGLRGFIAGSRPTPAVREAVKQAGLDLIENPEETAPVLRSARVLVNPVFAGSGVNTKCIEMLYTPAGLVGTPKALQGLAPEAQQCFGVSEDPAEFAELILQRQGGALGQQAMRDQARACYDIRRIDRVIQVLREAAQAGARPRKGARHAAA